MAIPTPVRRLLLPALFLLALFTVYTYHPHLPNFHHLTHPHPYSRDTSPDTPRTVPRLPPSTNQPLSASVPDGLQGPAHTADGEIDRLMMLRTILIFSKSYCPYSARAKSLLTQKYIITPAPYIVELDLHPLGKEMQDVLEKRTGRRTVPNVVVAGVSLGGCDEVEALEERGELVKEIRAKGGERVGRVLKVRN